MEEMQGAVWWVFDSAVWLMIEYEVVKVGFPTAWMVVRISCVKMELFGVKS